MSAQELQDLLKGEKIVINGTINGYAICIGTINGIKKKVVWVPDDDYFILKDNAVAFRYDDWIFQLVSYDNYFMLSRSYSVWGE